MKSALFINGVYRDVLTEMLAAQERGVETSYLQPFSGGVIDMLRKHQPSPSNPIRLYASTTDNLAQIGFTGWVVGWKDKRELSEASRADVHRHLKEFQPGEVKLFDGAGEIGSKAVNLIAVRDMRQMETLHSTALLRKVSDDLPLKKRTRAGGWSKVHDPGDLLELPSETRHRYDEQLSESVEEAGAIPEPDLHARLSAAPKIPDRIQIISIGYRRNPDVIVAVLRRAAGVCEQCGKPAPFLRKSDGSPYLEVHHLIPLASGGEDTVENAAAFCPNCHREAHHGGPQ